MAIVLPLRNERYPLLRVLTSSGFNLGAGVGGWQVQPMNSKRPRGYGFEVLNWSRVALPAVGEATLRYRFGRVDGDLVGIQSAAQVTSLLAGNGPSQAIEGLSAPDLRGAEVRIQAAPAVADGLTPAWRTVWWGQVEIQEDETWPGAAYPTGQRVYRCADGLARTRRWMLDRHAFIERSPGGTDVFYPSFAGALDTFGGCQGHPGYNAMVDGALRGNRDSAGSRTHNPTLDVGGGYIVHGRPGSPLTTTWNDLQVVEHALRVTRPKGEPLMSVVGYNGTVSATSGTTWLSQSASSWPVSDDESAFGMVARVCRRQRGRGMAWVDWADDTADPTGPLAVRLAVAPMVAGDVPVGYNGSFQAPLPGAASAVSIATVDLIGDHRLDATGFRLGQPDQHTYHAVESVGERIEVVATLSVLDTSLAKRFTTQADTAFNALDSAKRTDDAWLAVLHNWGIPRAWEWVAGDHDGGSFHRIDYRCDDAGRCIPPGFGTFLDSSPLTVEILPDLPLLVGYDYSGATAVRGGGTETGTPARRAPLILVRTALGRYLKGDEIGRPLTLQIDGDGITVYHSNDIATGSRVFGSVVAGTTLYVSAALGVTVALRTPNPVRMRSYADGHTADTARRKLTIRHPGLHLWLADYAAIWDIDTALRNSHGSPARYRAAGGTNDALPGVIRDDRPALAVLHAMACSWYLTARRTASWTLRACGFLPDFERVTDVATQATTTVTYPRLGQLITTIAAGGQTYTLGTPVSSISYDAEDGATTWETDWPGLDFQ